ncbi:MAG: hypothetical protein LBQ58_11090, partial [Synergistaceae bacterium]|nr:hypothetical protein [Synergistaceae bacterium]
MKAAERLARFFSCFRGVFVRLAVLGVILLLASGAFAASDDPLNGVRRIIPKSRLTITTVGPDEQNVMTFRGQDASAPAAKDVIS